MKRQWLITASAMGLAVVLALPPRPAPEQQPGTLSTILWFWSGVPSYPRSQQKWLLDQTRASLRQRLELTARGDSLLALVRAGRGVRSADGSITVLYERPLSADSAQRWLTALEREAALYPSVPHRGGAAVVVLHSTSQRGERFPRHYARWYAGPPGEPVCVTEASLTTPRGWTATPLLARDSTGVRTRVLDVCALFVRFGIPGPAVRGWVDAAQPAWWLRVGGLSDRVADARRGVRPTPWSGSGLAWTERGCVRGATLYCEALVGLRSSRGGSVAYRGDWYYWRGVTAERRREFLTALLTYQDPGRFAALWSSPDSVPQALARAYGKPAGNLVGEWARSWSPAYRTGPSVESRALLASLGWAVILLAGALVATLRWRAD